MRAQNSAERDLLKRILHAIRCLVRVAFRKGARPDLARLSQLLEQAADLREGGRYANERRLLMPLLRERCPPLGPVLERLAAEQERGNALLADVQQILTHSESAMAASTASSLAALVSSYLEVILGQLEVEENYILPVAADCLTPVDWALLNALDSPDRDHVMHPDQSRSASSLQ